MGYPPLWKHQKTFVKATALLDSVAFFAEMGTGKTRATIEAIKNRYKENHRLLRTIILCPKIVVDNWQDEWHKYADVRRDQVVVIKGTKAKRLRDFTKAVSCEHGLVKGCIIITNYEALSTVELFQLIKTWRPEILVCDESHKLKSVQAARSKLCVKLADEAKHRYLLTGTPVTNSWEDIFQQFRILDGGQTFGKDFYRWRSKWFRDANAAWAHQPNHFPKWEIRPELVKQLNDKIYTKALAARKDECLDLPDLVKQKVRVELSPEQKRHYKEMKNEFITFVQSQSGEKEAVLATLACTKALRLQQIVSGFAKTDAGNNYLFDRNPRLDALQELVEALAPENKIIVWANFKQNYEVIRLMLEKIGVEYAELHGEVTDKKREKNIKRFKDDPKCRVMVANQQAAGIGINLVEASYSIYFSRNFSLEDDLQSEARNHRGGSEIHDKITRIDLVAPGTIDEMVLDCLRDKKQVSDLILDWTAKQRS